MPASASPSTSEYVRFHALHRPDAIAVIDNGREIDYATFHRDLRKFTRALRGFGLPPRSLVAVACDGFYLHWLLLLACENLGLATASFLAGERREAVPLLARAQLVLSKQEVPEAGGAKRHLLTQDWLDGVFASPIPEEGDTTEDTPPGLDDPQRIRRSSGTTGGLKMMIATRRVEEQRVRVNLQILGLTSSSKLLITTHFTVGTMYSRATTCLRLGATCICETRTALTQTIERYRPSHAWLPQYQLKPLLDKLPGNFRESTDFTVILGGALVPEALWRKISERLARRIFFTYSCNEAGSITLVGADGVGTVLPDAQAEVVDERGAPVPAGQVGEVRVRSMSMMEGYLDNAEAAAKSFRDGWFYTGDAGMMPAPGQLKLVGRGDDLLNIGGLKVAPAEIEAMVERSVPLEDIGVTSIRNADGIGELCIAVVLKAGADAREVCERIAKRLPRDYGKPHIKAVASLPRAGEIGKLQRNLLKDFFTSK